MSGPAEAASPLAPAPLFPDFPEITYCDAQVLAELWGVRTTEAKVRLQNKLTDFGPDSVAGVLDHARSELESRSAGLCDLDMHNVGYGELKSLMTLWGVTEEEAKARASTKLFHGDSEVLYLEIEEGQRFERLDGVLADVGELDDDGAWEVWNRAGFRYCDAKILASAWGGDPWDAKVRGGHKIAAEGNDLGLRDALMTAAGQAGMSCSYVEADVGYEDAELLAQLWGLETVDEAKERVEHKASMGMGPDVQDILAHHRFIEESGHEQHEEVDIQPDLDAFFAADYSYCDAQIIATSWSVSEYEAKAAIGYKLRHGFTEQIPSMMAFARQQLVDGGAVARCSATESGVTDVDLAALATHWKTTPDATLVRAEEMLFQGEWTELQAAIAEAKSPKPKRRRWRLFRRK